MSRKKKLFRVLSMIVCVILAFQLCSVVGASAEVNTEFVFDANDFGSAVKNAKDGDIIVVFGEIQLSGSFGSADKTITVKRENENSRLIAGYGVEFQNIVFDGVDYISEYPMITTKGGFSAINCTFQNCKGEKGSVIGGAVQVESGDATFTGCSFYGNTSVAGGHIAIRNDCSANITNCSFKGGYAQNYGGAIAIFTGASCYIDSCVITENEANNYGGGVGNRSFVQIKNTKLYNNTTQYGGADIGNAIGATIDLQDSIEQLIALFKEDNIVPKGWICDYDFEENLYIPDIEPTQENALLKLDFEYFQPEPETPPETGDSEQPTDPEAPNNPSESESPDEGDSDDSGNSGNTDPTEPDEPQNPDEQETPESPSDPDTPQQDNPTEEDSTGSETPPKQSGLDENEGKQPEETTPSDFQTTDQDTEEPTTQPPSISNSGNDNGSNSATTTTNTNTNSSSTTTTDNRTTDNSRYSNTSDSNNTSTVNNYYTQQPETQLPNNQPGIQTIVVPVGSGEPIEQTIKIESSPERSVVESAEGMTLNVNVNVGSEDTQQQPAATAEQQSGVSWYQAAVLCLLSAILVCLIRKR